MRAFVGEVLEEVCAGSSSAAARPLDRRVLQCGRVCANGCLVADNAKQLHIQATLKRFESAFMNRGQRARLTVKCLMPSSACCCFLRRLLHLFPYDYNHCSSATMTSELSVSHSDASMQLCHWNSVQPALIRCDTPPSFPIAAAAPAFASTAYATSTQQSDPILQPSEHGSAALPVSHTDVLKQRNRLLQSHRLLLPFSPWRPLPARLRHKSISFCRW